MELTELIEDLRKSTRGKGLSESECGKLIEGRICLPSDFRPKEIEFKGHTHIRGARRSSLYHLLIWGQFLRRYEEIQPVLDQLLARAKTFGFNKEEAKAEYSVLWNPEEFQDEEGLNLPLRNIEVSLRAESVNPSKTHAIEVGRGNILETEDNKLVLRAQGDYNSHIRGLAAQLGFQYARLELTERDGNKILESIGDNPKETNFTSRLGIIIKSGERQIGFSTSECMKVVSSGDETGPIEIVAPVRILPVLEHIVGKPIEYLSTILNFNDVLTPHDSQITEFIRIYDLIEITKGKKLADIKRLAREIAGIKLNHEVLVCPYRPDNEPEVVVYSFGNEADASNLGLLDLPPRARLCGLSIKGDHINEYPRISSNYYNELSLGQNGTMPLYEINRFWLRVSVDSPNLLKLQEYVCREMGITFK